jgi:hypothetical protein
MTIAMVHAIVARGSDHAATWTYTVRVRTCVSTCTLVPLVHVYVLQYVHVYVRTYVRRRAPWYCNSMGDAGMVFQHRHTERPSVVGAGACGRAQQRTANDRRHSPPVTLARCALAGEVARPLVGGPGGAFLSDFDATMSHGLRALREQLRTSEGRLDAAYRADAAPRKIAGRAAAYQHLPAMNAQGGAGTTTNATSPAARAAPSHPSAEDNTTSQFVTLVRSVPPVAAQPWFNERDWMQTLGRQYAFLCQAAGCKANKTFSTALKQFWKVGVHQLRASTGVPRRGGRRGGGSSQSAGLRARHQLVLLACSFTRPYPYEIVAAVRLPSRAVWRTESLAGGQVQAGLGCHGQF